MNNIKAPNDEPQFIGAVNVTKDHIISILDDILRGINQASGGVIDRSVTKGDIYANYVDEMMEHISKRAREVGVTDNDHNALIASVLVGGTLGLVARHVEVINVPPDATDEEAAKAAADFNEIYKHGRSQGNA